MGVVTGLYIAMEMMITFTISYIIIRAIAACPPCSHNPRRILRDILIASAPDSAAEEQ